MVKTENSERVILLPFIETVFDISAEVLVIKYGSITNIPFIEYLGRFMQSINKVAIDGYRFLGILPFEKEDKLAFEYVKTPLIYHYNLESLKEVQTFDVLVFLDNTAIYMISDKLTTKMVSYIEQINESPVKAGLPTAHFLEWEKEHKK